MGILCIFFFFQAEDGIRDGRVTGVQTCALPICLLGTSAASKARHATGKFARLPNRPTQCSMPQKEVSKRSEERRVGKECRSRWSPKHQKKKMEFISNILYIVNILFDT